MDRNHDFRQFDKNKGRNQRGGEPVALPFTVNKTSKNDDDLIIDETSVYEIDQECYERARRNRLRQKKE